jgi:hypothetical protein
MRRHGINYDTGFDPSNEGTSRPRFDIGSVRRDMAVIADDLHCDAIRVSGGEPERVFAAAQAAAEAGLEVWYAPFPCELPPEALLDHLTDGARRAEQIRTATTVDVVYVAGCEISLFNRGFLPGDDLMTRLNALQEMAGSRDRAAFGTLGARLNAAPAGIAAAARQHFGGRISYASGPWEHIDWTPFDIVGADAYRMDGDTAGFREELRGHLRHGKPVAATEFGCCAYRGAGDRGGMGWMVLDESDTRVREPVERDESEQSRYLIELLEVFEDEGLDAAFWFTYAGWRLPHRDDDLEHDLDLGSYGVQAVLPDGTLRPKEVFGTLAAAYRTSTVHPPQPS